MAFAASLAVLGVAPQAAEVVVKNFAFRASDGVEIGATLYRPAAAGVYPAVIFGHGFGQSRFEDQGQTRGADASSWTSIPSQARWYAREGYVVLAVDSRYQKLLDPGNPDDPADDTLLKPGGMAGLNNSREIRDHQEQIDWLIADPDGLIAPARVDASRLGMSGYSYEANQSLLTAAHDPRLRAIAVLSGWTDYFTDKFPGLSGLERGVPEFLQLAGPLLANDFTDNDGRGNIDPTWFEIFLQVASGDYRLTDLWFRKASLPWQAHRFRAAVFLAQAWNEFLIPADQATGLFQKLAVPKKLYIGGWGHPPSEATADEGRYVLQLRRQFFDHWLKDVDNGVMEWPVELASLPWAANERGGARAPRRYTRLPLEEARYRPLYPRAGGRLLAQPPAAGETPDVLTRRSNPEEARLMAAARQELTAGLERGLAAEHLASLRRLFGLGARRAWGAETAPGVETVSYVSEPLVDDWTLLGSVHLDALLENDGLDASRHNNNLSVRLLMLPPASSNFEGLQRTAAGEVLITYGFYAIEQVASRTRPDKPNWVHASIALMPTHIVVPKGSRLLIRVAGCDFPNTFPCLGESTTRIHHDPRASGNEGFEAGYPGIATVSFPVLPARVRSEAP